MSNYSADHLGRSPEEDGVFCSSEISIVAASSATFIAVLGTIGLFVVYLYPNHFNAICVKRAPLP